MKKTYINPEMQVVKIEVRQMLTVSAPIGGSQGNGEALSRDWFDDEDE